MRKGFDGLCALVRDVFGDDPLSGSLFLFVNRRRDRIKMLWWDEDGLVVFYKRLEQGTFERIAADDDAEVVHMDATQLAMLLGGVNVASARRRRRYSRAG